MAIAYLIENAGNDNLATEAFNFISKYANNSNVRGWLQEAE